MILHLSQGMKIRDTYTLEQLLGVGASGEVWRATDGTKTVAIKFMNETLITSDKADKHRVRLEREIHALGLLQHPHVPALYDFDLDFERPFIVMEYVSSPPYEHLLNTGEMMRVPVNQRVEIMEQIADALTAAHEAGIIHRDIKPGNMNGIEHPYLLDFSIALEEENLEHTNFNVGTTIYMTPAGESPDRLADNYSFAVVAYEVIFGNHPIFPPMDDARNMGAYSRLVAFNRLTAGDWSIPSHIPSDKLPHDLKYADLKSLDAVFNRAFGDRNQRYVNLIEFISSLKKAILTPETIDYLAKMAVTQYRETVAPPPTRPTQMPKSENFTMLEVESAQKPPSAPQAPKPQTIPDNYSTREVAQVGVPSAIPASTVAPSDNLGEKDNFVGRIRKIFSGLVGKK